MREEDVREFQRSYDESVDMARRMDGLPPLGPVRSRRMAGNETNPYEFEYMLTANEEEGSDEEDTERMFEEEEEEERKHRRRRLSRMHERKPQKRLLGDR